MTDEDLVKMQKVDDAIQRMRKAIRECNERDYEKAQADFKNLQPIPEIPKPSDLRSTSKFCKLKTPPPPQQSPSQPTQS